MKRKILFPVIDPVATGKNILHLRQQLGFTVGDLQEFFGFSSPQAIYSWQQGKNIPSTDHLLALSHLFGISMNEILVIQQPNETSSRLSMPSGAAGITPLLMFHAA